MERDQYNCTKRKWVWRGESKVLFWVMHTYMYLHICIYLYICIYISINKCTYICAQITSAGKYVIPVGCETCQKRRMHMKRDRCNCTNIASYWQWDSRMLVWVMYTYIYLRICIYWRIYVYIWINKGTYIHVQIISAGK